MHKCIMLRNYEFVLVALNLNQLYQLNHKLNNFKISVINQNGFFPGFYIN